MGNGGILGNQVRIMDWGWSPALDPGGPAKCMACPQLILLPAEAPHWTQEDLEVCALPLPTATSCWAHAGARTGKPGTLLLVAGFSTAQSNRVDNQQTDSVKEEIAAQVESFASGLK